MADLGVLSLSSWNYFTYKDETGLMADLGALSHLLELFCFQGCDGVYGRPRGSLSTPKLFYFQGWDGVGGSPRVSRLTNYFTYKNERGLVADLGVLFYFQGWDGVYGRPRGSLSTPKLFYFQGCDGVDGRPMGTLQTPNYFTFKDEMGLVADLGFLALLLELFYLQG